MENVLRATAPFDRKFCRELYSRKTKRRVMMLCGRNPLKVPSGLMRHGNGGVANIGFASDFRSLGADVVLTGKGNLTTAIDRHRAFL